MTPLQTVPDQIPSWDARVDAFGINEFDSLYHLSLKHRFRDADDPWDYEDLLDYHLDERSTFVNTLDGKRRGLERELSDNSEALASALRAHTAYRNETLRTLREIHDCEAGATPGFVEWFSDPLRQFEADDSQRGWLDDADAAELASVARNGDAHDLHTLAWILAERRRTGNWGLDMAPDDLPPISVEDAFQMAFGARGAGIMRGRLGAKIVDVPMERGEVTAGIEQQADDIWNIPGPLGDFVRWLNETAHVLQPMLALAAGILILGAVAGRRYRLAGLNTMTNTSFLAIAPTGAGKDHARKQGKRLMSAAGCSSYLMGDDATSDAALYKALGRFPIGVQFSDEYGRELGTVRKGHAQSHEMRKFTAAMKLFSDAGGMHNGKEYAEPGRERVDIYNPALNIYATTTRTSLTAALSSSDVASGLLNRMIAVSGDPEPEIPQLSFEGRAGDEPPEGLVNWMSEFASYVPEGAGNLSGTIQHIASVAPKFWIDVQVRLGDARVALQSVKDEETKHLRATGDPTHELWARYFENVVKLAMIRAIADDFRGPEITEEHVAWARTIVRRSIEYMAAIMREHVADTPHEANLKHVLGVIREHSGPDGWISKSEITNRTPRLDGKTRGSILHDLVDSSQVEIFSAPSTGGRPAVRYRLASD